MTKWVEVRHGKLSVLASGAATMTFDARPDYTLILRALDGPARDRAALRADARRSFKSIGQGHGQYPDA